MHAHAFLRDIGNKIDSKINRIQEKALRIAYGDSTSQFKEFLEEDNSVSIHQKNLVADD